MSNDFRPVDLLSDAKGVYGIGLKEECEHYPHLILRFDVLAASALPTGSRETLLHTLPSRRFLRSSYEWDLLGVMLDEALKRNPRYQDFKQEESRLYQELNKRKDLEIVRISDLQGQELEVVRIFQTLTEERVEEEIEGRPREVEAWWKGERGKLYRQIKWGQRRRQLINLNGMLKQLIAEAAEPNALKLARRFHPLLRENIYRAAAISPRALQLIDAFPVLGMVIYTPMNNDHWRDRAPDAVKMVERGVRLNQIAAFMDIPLWARKIKPAVATWFEYVSEDLHYYLPEKTWEQRLWLWAAFETTRRWRNPEFASWIARNVLKLARDLPDHRGNRIEPVLWFLTDMNDWVMEAKRQEPRCITRPFSPDMSVNTVRRENELWHDAIAKCDAAKSKFKIPPPWYPAAESNGYSIVPVDSAEELWKEGRVMHHCVGSYDYRVAAGNCYVYSVRQGDNRIATFELVKERDKVKPGQIRAACNAEPPKEVKIAVRKWISNLRADWDEQEAA
jgi:hypothetical protein